MLCFFVAGLAFVHLSERQRSARLTVAVEESLSGVDGNTEGKETRFGIAGSTLTAVVTSNAATGSTNAMHDSFTPLGGMALLVNMLLGEVVFGGLGTGLYSIVMAAVLAAFLAGLMIGRTPEYLGKKIGPAENKMIVLYAIVAPLTVLPLTALAVMTRAGLAGLTTNAGPHGFMEILFAYTSSFANNGQAFAGLNANTVFYNVTTAVAMLVGRFGLAAPALALAGLFAQQGRLPVTRGTLKTDNPGFAVFLIACLVIMTALCYVPALALGPVLEHLMLFRG
jgi:K+-transporting ATPase ATPase A chain